MEVRVLANAKTHAGKNSGDVKELAKVLADSLRKASDDLKIKIIRCIARV
jgi:CRISPR/Cas system CSM-associated protein Csm2 small subunit